MSDTLWSVVVLAISFVTVSEACGGTYTGSSGEITSPNYPSHYNSDQTCTYNIVPSSSVLLRLVFVDFETEAGYDFVYVFNSTDVLVASLTGERSGTVVESSSSYRVVLALDPWTTRRGFRATWDAAPSTTVNPDVGLHTQCPVSFALTLVNSTATKCKVLESVILSTSLRCTHTCLLLNSCIYCKYEGGDMCIMYEVDASGTIDLTNTFAKI